MDKGQLPWCSDVGEVVDLKIRYLLYDCTHWDRWLKNAWSGTVIGSSFLSLVFFDDWGPCATCRWDGRVGRKKLPVPNIIILIACPLVTVIIDYMCRFIINTHSISGIYAKNQQISDEKNRVLGENFQGKTIKFVHIVDDPTRRSTNTQPWELATRSSCFPGLHETADTNGFSRSPPIPESKGNDVCAIGLDNGL